MPNRSHRFGKEVGAAAWALIREIIFPIWSVWGPCFLMLPVVFYTTAFTVYGVDFLRYDLPLPLAMRRTMLVLAPAAVIAATTLVLCAELVLAYAGRRITPSHNPLKATRHTRRGGTYAVIFAAWCFFPVAFRLGPNIALFAAIGAGVGGIIVYRIFDIPRLIANGWRRYRRGAPPLTAAQQLSATDEMYLDVYLAQKSVRKPVKPGEPQLVE